MDEKTVEKKVAISLCPSRPYEIMDKVNHYADGTETHDRSYKWEKYKSQAIAAIKAVKKLNISENLWVTASIMLLNDSKKKK